MPTRRQFIRQLSIASSLGLIASAGLDPLRAFATEEGDGFMPDEGELAEELCGGASVRFLETELDDIWMRDIGANFLTTGARYLRSELVGEGGGIEVDGHGTGIMTESCRVNANRNPGWTCAQVEEELKACLGLRKIIWLPGILGKDITDAQADRKARELLETLYPGREVVALDIDAIAAGGGFTV